MKRDYAQLENFLVKALAVVGLLALLIVGSFSTIALARFVGPVLSSVGETLSRAASAAAVTLSSVFIPAGNNLTVSTEASSIKSGETFILSWNLEGAKKNGSYSLSYPCIDGFHIKATTAARGTEVVLCNTEFRFINNGNALRLTPISTESRYVDMPITLSFTENGEDEALETATVVITVTNDNPSKTPVSTAPTGNTNPSNQNTGTSGTRQGQPTSQTITNIPIGGSTARAENPNGKPDLKVSIITTGVVDKITGVFATTSSLYRANRIAVRFAVENIGDKTSNEWMFNAILPTYPPYTYNSDSQPKLKPGDRIEFTIGFDQAVEGTQPVKFEIDPRQVITESNETNNNISIDLKIL